MNIVSILLVCAMAFALMNALIRSAFSGTQPERQPENIENNKIFNKIFYPDDHDEDNDATNLDLHLYCWVANMLELNEIEDGAVDSSVIKGPIPLISSRNDGSIRIINTERGQIKGREGDLDIAEIFPSDTDELYLRSNKCFSHHEADIVFVKETGTIHLRVAEERAKRDRPESMYSFSSGEAITDMTLTNMSRAVIGDYLFIFTYGDNLPKDILKCNVEPKKNSAHKTASKTKPGTSRTPDAKKRTITAHSKKKAPAGSGRKRHVKDSIPDPTIIAS